MCVSVDYRLSRRATWPDHIVDVKTALAWVRAPRRRHGGDPDFVAITGGSSGGHLAALAALTPDDAEYRPRWGRGAVRLRPASRSTACTTSTTPSGQRAPGEMRLIERFVVEGTVRSISPRPTPHAAPLAHVNEHAPPFLVVQGTSDNLIFPAESRAFVDRLRETSRSARRLRRDPREPNTPSMRCRRSGPPTSSPGVERFLVHVHATHQAAALAAGPTNPP